MASNDDGVIVEGLLKEHYPNLGEEILHYVCGVLESPDDFGSVDDVYEAVGDVLLDSASSSSEEEIRGFCGLLYATLHGDGEGLEDDSVSDENKLLEAPVQLSSKLRIEDDDDVSRSTIWTAQGNDSRKGMDQKKLDKADAKLRQKQERKALKEREQQTTNVVCAGPTTNQAASRQTDMGSGQTRDIKIENFDIAFGNNVLLSGADLSLVYSRRYGLVGRNGVGKSTLLRAIAGRELRLPGHMTILHVEQEVVGDDTTAVDSVLESDEERTHLLKLEQELVGGAKQGRSDDPPASSAQLAQVYQRLEEIDAAKAPARAAGILAGLGFSPEMQGRSTKEFSGGWRMRIALARALFATPDLLLLDEPTNMLDLKAILWLENYLQNWPTTLLVVSHDRYFLTTVVTDIIHMHSQSLDSYRGNYDVFIQTKTEKLKNQQKEYEAQLQYRQHLQAYIDRWRYNAKRAPQAQMRIKILEKLPELKPVTVEPDVKFRFPDVESLSPPILQLYEVSFAYVPGHDVFQKTNISADMESRIALVGENGTGKTTLVKLLTGDLSPADGYRTAHRNLKIAYFTQHHVDQLDLNVSALELIQSRYPGKKEEEYRHQLGSFQLSGDLALRPIISLSGGQKSRLAFALLAMSRPNFLILDEPTNHLDVETVEALGKALSAFKGGVVLVSHDEHLINLCTTEVWLCKDQTVHRLEGGLGQYKTEIENEFRIEK